MAAVNCSIPTVSAAAPSVPTDPSATALSPTEIRIDWTDGGGLNEATRIEWSDDDGETWTRLEDVNYDIETRIQTGLTADTAYLYRLKTLYPGTPGSAYTAEFGTTTQATGGGLTITAVNIINCDTQESEGTLSDEGTIDIGEIGTSNIALEAVGSTGVESVTFALSGGTTVNRTENVPPYALGGDTGGSFNPVAFNAGAHNLVITPYPQDAAGGSAGTPLDIDFTVTFQVTPPSAPTGLTVTGTSANSISLSWTAGVGGGTVQTFRVERSDDGEAGWAEVGSTPGITVFTNTGLDPETTYYYRVYARNTADDSDPTSTVSDTTDAGSEPGAKPVAGNTGYSGSLVSSGSISTSSNGQVIELKDINGKINVNHNNVEIRNCRINGGLATGYTIQIKTSVTGTNVHHCELIGSDSAAIYGKNYTAEYNNVHHHGGDGFKASGPATIQYNYVHHLGMNSGAHADGVQCGGMSPTGSLFIRYNNFDMPRAAGGGPIQESGQYYRHNAAIMLQPEANTNPPPSIWPIDDVEIIGNWMNGGNYTVYVTDQDGTEFCTNVTVSDNFFGRDYQNDLLVWKNPSGTNVWSNNRWEDTDAVISLTEATT